MKNIKLDQFFFDQLSNHPMPPYTVQTFSRDCDMCEVTRITVYKSYISLVKAYMIWVEGLEWAEGTESFEILEHSEPEGSHTRDRVMEAYENGNGSSIYV